MDLRALAAALLVLPLASFATAAPPQPQSWGHDGVTEVRDISLAANAFTLSAALAPPSAQQTTTAPTDLAILDAETGFAANGTSAGPVPFGRNFTAVSGDGLTVVSVGLDTTQGALGGGLASGQPKVRMYSNRLSGAARWTPGATFQNATLTLDFGVPVDLLVSTDGTRAVLATQIGPEFVVQAFTVGGSSFGNQFTYRAAGNVTDLAATPDLSTIARAGRIPEGTAAYAVVHVFPYQGNSPSRSHVDRSANGTQFQSVAITGDGNRIVAGDARGQLHVFTGATASQPVLLPGQSTLVRRLLMAEDGSRIAALMGNALTLYDATTAPPSLLYTATAAGGVTDVAGNRTLGILALAVNGTGIVGYGDLSATPLWTLPATGQPVAMDASGTYVAYAPTLSRIAVARIPRGLSFEHATGGDAGPVKIARPQGSATFELLVRNAGAAPERVRFEFPRELDLSFAADAPALAIAPDQTARVNVTVTTGPLFAGTRSFNVSAVSQTSGLRDDTILTLQLQDEPDVRFLVNDTTDIAMKPGETRLVVLGVLNNGSTDAAVGIRATQAVTRGEPWVITLDPASLTLAPDSVTTVRVNVHAPAGATDGTSNTLRFTLEGANVSDQVSLTFRINPTLGVAVEAAGRVKFVEPGGIAFYNVTVTNTGSLPRRFEAFFTADAQGGKSWAVDMDTSPFQLQPGATQTILVRIFAPQDAVPNVDRVGVFVQARSFPEQVNETFAEGNLTLFANAVEPKPTTTTTTEGQVIPGLALPIVASALATVALLHRRRRF